MSTQEAISKGADQVRPLLTTKDLSGQLKVEEPYVDWLRHRHDLPWVRVGGEVRFDAGAVRAWLQQRAAGASKTDDLTVLSLRARLKGRLDFAEWDALQRHIIALACYRGTEGDDLLEQAFTEVHDPAYRRVMFTVLAIARLMNESDYYRSHSALVADGSTAEEATDQLQDARENRDRRLGGIAMRLVDELPNDIEAPLARFLAGDVRGTDLALEGLTGVAISVATIRELCAAEPKAETKKPAGSK